MARRRGVLLLLAALLLAGHVRLGTCHGKEGSNEAGSVDVDDGEELSAEALAALLDTVVPPYDPNIRVAAAASQDLLDLQATDPNMWRDNVNLGDDGADEDPTDWPHGGGAWDNIQGKVIYDSTSRSRQESGRLLGQEEPTDDGDDDGPDPVEDGTYEAGRLEPSPGYPVHVGAQNEMGQAESGSTGSIGDEPQLSEVAAALKAQAAKHQALRQELGQQQESEQGSDDDAGPQVGDVIKEEPDLPGRSRRLLSDPEEAFEESAALDTDAGDTNPGDTGSDTTGWGDATWTDTTWSDTGAAGDGGDAATQDTDTNTYEGQQEGEQTLELLADEQPADEQPQEEVAEVAATAEDETSSESYGRRLLQSGSPAGNNKPGMFTAGDNPLQHKAGIASDNPSGVPPLQPPAGTPSSATNTAGILPALLRSFNNDLIFAVKMQQGSASGRRRLQQAGDASESTANDDATDGSPDASPSDDEIQLLTQADFALSAEERERAVAERDAVLETLAVPTELPNESADVPLDDEAAGKAYDAAVAAVRAMGLLDQLQGESGLEAEQVPESGSNEAGGAVAEEGAEAVAEGAVGEVIEEGGQAVEVEDVGAAHWDSPRQLAEASSKLSRKLVSGFAINEKAILPGAWIRPAQEEDKPLYGISYSWRRSEECDGTKRVCQCPHHDELDRDLEVLHRYSRRVRTYSVECPDLMRMVAHMATVAPESFSWMLGVWIGRDAAANEAQIQALERLLTEFPSANYHAIAVGNEVIHRRDMEDEDLIAYIRKVRAMVASVAKAQGSTRLAAVPITTVDVPWGISAKLAAEIDVVSVNLHPFYSGLLDTSQKGWVKTAVGGALYHINKLRSDFKKKPVLVAEIGWPTASGAADTNIGSVDNAKAFIQAWTKAAKQYSVPYFYHEAFDAAWKGKLRQASATLVADEHFGLVSADRNEDKQLLA